MATSIGHRGRDRGSSAALEARVCLLPCARGRLEAGLHWRVYLDPSGWEMQDLIHL